MFLKILAIIPARGGSKGIPHKNIKILAGKPLIEWTIQAAIALPSISRIIVSTDDNEISSMSLGLGAEVPFIRPPELSTDSAKTIDVVFHLLDWLMKKNGYSPDFILLLQPTSPLRSSTDIQAAIDLLKVKKNADAVVSVSPVLHPLAWLRKVDSNGKLLPFLTTEGASRRQDSKQPYQLNGCLYLVRTSTLIEEHTFTPKNTFAYIMSPEHSIDIDTPWDFYLADLILRDKNGKRNI
jgi:CMP-N,N'-diacetyllegionaminic acid synthase